MIGMKFINMKIDEDKVPTNLDEAVELLKNSFDEIELHATQKDKVEPSQLHFTVGMYLRNQWSLWDKDTILVKWFYDNYKIEAD
jgi:hypothetical protein